MRKLEITQRLERMSLRNPGKIAILNMPAAYFCDKNCEGCIAKSDEAVAERTERLPVDIMLKIMEFFKREYSIQFITINGRGDPFHPLVKHETLGKIAHANSIGVQSYVFTSGDNLDEKTCILLAEQKVNVMISLFGNDFADVFEDGEAAQGIRQLMLSYKGNQPDGATRLGMNYVVSDNDLANPQRIGQFKRFANREGIFFVANVNFFEQGDKERLKELAAFMSDFGLQHSTFVDGRCQMGAGSSVTVAANGDLYRCPYMLKGSDGNIMRLGPQQVVDIISGYISDRKYVCVLRKTDR